MTSYDRTEDLGKCPHCGGPIQMDPYPPMEAACCVVCRMRSPLFHRYTPGQQGVRGALEWMRLGNPAGANDVSLVSAARRVVNAYDREDYDAFARAVEEIRARLPGRRISGAARNRGR